MPSESRYALSLFLRDVERLAPPALVGPAMRRLLPGRNPFTPEFHAKRCVFIRIPKNAGTSLMSGLGIGRVGHVPIERFHAYDAAAARAYFKFCIVRNPWSRLLSAFNYLHPDARRKDPAANLRHADHLWAERHLGRYGSFGEFVLALGNRAVRRRVMRYPHFLPQTHWICRSGQARPAVDFIGRFEALPEALEIIAARIGRQQGAAEPLPHLRASRRVDYREHYTPEAREIVASIYAADIEAFGYDFEETPGG